MYKAYRIRDCLTKFIPDIRSMSTRNMLRRESDKQKSYILERDKVICKACIGDSGIDNVEVAHITPVNEHGTSDPYNLITLCRGVKEHPGCHELFDDGYASRKEVSGLLHGYGIGKLRQTMLNRKARIFIQSNDLLIGGFTSTYPLLRSGRLSEASVIMKSSSVKYGKPEVKAEFYLHLATIERRRRTEESVMRAKRYLDSAKKALGSCSSNSGLQEFLPAESPRPLGVG